MRLCALALVLVLISSVLMAQKKEPAEIIFLNGNIYPGSMPSSRTAQIPPSIAGNPSSRYEALAVRSGRLLAIGSNSEIKKLKGPHTQVVDLGGNFVMPGFNDAHVHLAAGGFLKLNLDLTGTKSLAEMKQRIAARSAEAAPGEWVVGRGWDETNWPEHRLPSRQDLDAITAEHPAVMIRVDSHIGVASTAALAAAGFGNNTPDPPGGKIDHNANGELTGVVRENALEIVISKIPQPSPAQRRRAIELALDEAARWGITSLQDSPDVGGGAEEASASERAGAALAPAEQRSPGQGDWQNFLVLEDMEREGQLKLRVSKWLIFSDDLPKLENHRRRHEQSDPMLHTGMLKGFLDGSLGSHTAALLAPYSDQPDNRGVSLYPQDKLNDLVCERLAARFQIGLHAIGDAAARQALDAFAEGERYARENAIEPVATAADDGFRFRIEHVQVLAPDDIPRFHELGIVASLQPSHLLTDMQWVEQRIGPDRSKHAYPWKELLVSGARLAFGSDYPIESCNPFRGLYAAVTRKSESGREEFHPEQKITISEAIAAFTTGSAYAELAEREKGTLQPGMLADFVVLDRDLLRITPAEILGTRVLLTVVGGKIVYQVE
jgi:predicted amidohydrolase YtcJ